MISKIAIAVLIGQTVASPPAPGPDWRPIAPGPGEYRRLARSVEHQSDDLLIGKIDVCNCEPTKLIDDLTLALRDIPAASIVRTTEPACEAKVEHLVVTGLADGRSQKNFDLYTYRDTGALVTIMYSFTKTAPVADDEVAMRAICATKTDLSKATSGPL